MAPIQDEGEPRRRMTRERWERVERLYHAALEHDATERSHFLATACAGDDMLRRDVESLLDADESGGEVLEYALIIGLIVVAAIGAIILPKTSFSCVPRAPSLKFFNCRFRYQSACPASFGAFSEGFPSACAP